MRRGSRRLPIQPEERARFGVIAALLAVCALVQECNEIVATSGLVSRAGSANLLWAWTLDALLAAGGACVYALVVDRIDRVTLAARLLLGFGLGYGALFALFWSHVPARVCYGALLVLNNQQAYLAVVLIWTLAKDVFSLGQGARLFGLLGSITLGGSLLGNLLATAAGHWRPQSAPLLLVGNGALTLGCALLVLRSRTLLTALRQEQTAEPWTEGLAGSLRYVWRERSLRYFSCTTLTTGASWTILTYLLLSRLAESTHAAHAPGAFQTAYGLFTFARPAMQAVIQALFAGRLIRRVGLRYLFVVTPLTLLIGLTLASCFAGLAPVVIGMYLLYAVFGVEEPAGHVFLTQVPEGLRGRVSALSEGCFAPAGYVLGCLLIVLAQHLSTAVPLALPSEHAISLALAVICTASGLWAAYQLRHLAGATPPGEACGTL